jgi:hypothetical protein
MKNTLAGLSALAVCAGFILPAQGSDDVHQPACFGWFRRDPPPPTPPPPTTRYYAAPADPCCPQPTCNACPQTTCTQQYSLQSYYQQVTTYQTQTNYEPVTTYQSSSYYEPVVTYRTSCYYCPTTCSYKQTQVPETSYVLKSKCTPVQSYVAKSVQVPVQSCQKVYYYQPQTVCTQSPPPCCPTAVAQAPCCQQPPQVQAGTMGAAPVNPPQVSATPGWTPPVIKDNDGSQDKYFRKETAPPPTNGGSGGTSWQPVSPPPPAPIAPSPGAPPAHVVKLERIVFGADAIVEGEVVRGDKSPRSDAKILFVNANQSTLRETVTANHSGRFQTTLAAGGWLIYIYNFDGEAVFHSRIEVSDENTGRIVLVSR